MVAYRTRLLAFTGSNHGNFFKLTFVCFFLVSFFFLLELILVWIRVRVRISISRSRLYLLHENDNRLLFEMASTVYERENCGGVD